MKLFCAILIFLTASFADAATYYLRADVDTADRDEYGWYRGVYAYGVTEDSPTPYKV